MVPQYIAVAGTFSFRPLMNVLIFLGSRTEMAAYDALSGGSPRCNNTAVMRWEADMSAVGGLE